MNLLKFVIILINTVSFIYMIYYLIIAIFAFKRKKLNINNNFKNKFAIVIPARNEELVIGNLIQSLNKQNYPKDKYDVFVLPNNCSDDTEKISQKMGAKIIDSKKKLINSKGDALRTAFENLKDKDYNAYIIFDADNIVHPEFINNMNNYLCLGYRVAQGYRDSKNPSDTWISSSHSLHYIIQNFFMNKSRMNINKSCFINGTGFMISKEIINEYGYDSSTITEDIELTVKCGLNNEKIAFVENAITYDEQPTDFIVSWKQRKRWSVGTLQCLKQYFKLIVKDILKNKNFESIDSIMFLVAPIVQLIGTFNCLLQIFLNFLIGAKVDYLFKSILLILYYITNIILALGIVKISQNQIKIYIKGIIFLTIFYLSWVPINLIALFEKELKWEKIEHKKSVSLESILTLNYINNGLNIEK